MTDTKFLYETDYALWLDRTIDDLKAKRLDTIDWENLIEEVADLGRSQRQELSKRLTTLLEHCLKLCHTNYELDYRGWKDTIRRSQREIKKLLINSPSLKNYWYETFPLSLFPLASAQPSNLLPSLDFRGHLSH